MRRATNSRTEPLLGRHPDCPIEANDFAVDHQVTENMRYQACELSGASETRREQDIFCERFTHGL